MELDIDYDDLQYICTTVFPSPQTSKYLRDQKLIHYRPTEPQFGDRFVQTEFIDYGGNDPYRFFTLGRDGKAARGDSFEVEPALPGMTLKRNYVLNSTSASPAAHVPRDSSDAGTPVGGGSNGAVARPLRESAPSYATPAAPVEDVVRRDTTTGWLMFVWLYLSALLARLSSVLGRRQVAPTAGRRRLHDVDAGAPRAQTDVAEALDALDDAIGGDEDEEAERRETFKDLEPESAVESHDQQVDEPSSLLGELTQQRHVDDLYSDNLRDTEPTAPTVDVEQERPRALSRDPVHSDEQLFGTSTVIEKIDGDVIAQIDLPTALPTRFYDPQKHFGEYPDFEPHITLDGEPLAAATTSSNGSELLDEERQAQLAAINKELLDVTRDRATPPNTPNEHD